MNSRDIWRHVIVIVLTFAGGAIATLSDPAPTALLILKHGAIACFPTLTALRMTLEGEKR